MSLSASRVSAGDESLARAETFFVTKNQQRIHGVQMADQRQPPQYVYKNGVYGGPQPKAPALKQWTGVGVQNNSNDPAYVPPGRYEGMTGYPVGGDDAPLTRSEQSAKRLLATFEGAPRITFLQQLSKLKYDLRRLGVSDVEAGSIKASSTRGLPPAELAALHRGMSIGPTMPVRTLMQLTGTPSQVRARKAGR